MQYRYSNISLCLCRIGQQERNDWKRAIFKSRNRNKQSGSNLGQPHSSKCRKSMTYRKIDKKAAFIRWIKAVFLLAFTKLSGRSDWTRTSGLLVPKRSKRARSLSKSHFSVLFSPVFGQNQEVNLLSCPPVPCGAFPVWVKLWVRLFRYQKILPKDTYLGQINGSNYAPPRCKT